MAPAEPTGRTPRVPHAPEQAHEQGDTQQRLHAYFQGMDESGLMRVAQAVEMARATDTSADPDETIMAYLRPLIRPLKPVRVPTYLRSLCVCLEPFLINGDDPFVWAPKGVVRRATLSVWWRVLMASPHRPLLAAVEAEYRNALRVGQPAEAESVVVRGRQLAAQATRALLDEAQASPSRRAALVARLGGETPLAEMAQIAVLLAADSQLTPCFIQIRTAAPRAADGRILDLTPLTALLARDHYVRLSETVGQAAVTELFLTGLMCLLVQPWQAMRLLRLLSGDMATRSGSAFTFIPARLFGDLSRALGDMGRLAEGQGVATRRVWLLTCARLIADAGAMVQGMNEEVAALRNPELDALALAARQKVAQAADQFASVAVRDAAVVLPHRQERDGEREIRVVPDTQHIPTAEEVAVAQAAAALFSACRRVAVREGFDRAIQAKEADLESRFQTALAFRQDYLRARGRSPAVMAQLDAILQVLRGLPRTDALRELTQRADRAVARFR